MKPIFVSNVCGNTGVAPAAGVAIFIAQTFFTEHAIRANVIAIITVATISAMALSVYRAFVTHLTIGAVIGAITASSASCTFVVKIIAALTIGAVHFAFYCAVNAIIPALGAHFGAVFAKIAICTMHKCVALKAFAAFTAVEPFLEHSTFDTEIAAEVAYFGTVFAGTAITADSGDSVALDAFATLGTQPVVVFTANRAVACTGIALTVYVKAFTAFDTVVIAVAIQAKLAIGADVFAVVANAAVKTIYFAEIAKTAIGAGLSVCLVTFYAHFAAIFAKRNAILAEVTLGTENCAGFADVATVALVSVGSDIARITVRTDLFVIVAVNTKQMVAAFAITETFYTAKTFFADSIFIIPALTAIGASYVIL